MIKKLPKISIITPTLNQGCFIEQTIKSVITQNYPDLEYIVIDGGSCDGTIKILKKYSKRIRWISEKDKGQSDAINKGLRMARGDIIGYLNSDDYLEKDALITVGQYFSNDKNAFWLTGKCFIVDKQCKLVRQFVTIYKNWFLKYFRSFLIFFIVQFISQPSTFWRREILQKVGYFDESLSYDMDYDYWIRIWKKYELHFIDKYLSYYRIHNFAKAVVSPETQFAVDYQIVKRYSKSKIILMLHKIHSDAVLIIYRNIFMKKRL